MPTIIFRINEQLLAALNQTAEDTYTNRSSLIRQSIARNLDIIRNVERPAILAYHKNRIPKLFTEGDQ